MANVDAILAKYRFQIDEVLSGRGKIDAILRRGAIFDSLNSGIPQSAPVLPEYSRTMPDISGAPQDANESLSDLMSFVQGLPSGAVGDRGAPVDWGAIDSRRAGNRIDVQKLLDQRSNEEAATINTANQDRDQIGAQLGMAGAQGRISADQVAGQEQASVNQLLKQIMGMEANAGLAQDRMGHENQMASDRLLAEMSKPANTRPFVIPPGGAMFDPEGKQLAAVAAKAPGSKLLSQDELAQQLQLRAASRSPGVTIETYGSPVPAMDPDTGQAMLYQPGNRGGMEPTGLAPVPPAPKPVPATAKKAMAGNESTLKQIDSAIATVKKNPDAFGPSNIIGETAKQYTDPKGVGPRSKVSQIAAKKRHDISGAAVSLSEAPNLAPFLPSSTDRADAIVQKLTTLRDNLAAENEEIRAAFDQQPNTSVTPVETDDIDSLINKYKTPQ